MTAYNAHILSSEVANTDFERRPLSAHFENWRAWRFASRSFVCSPHHGLTDQRNSTSIGQDRSNPCCLEEEGVREGSKLYVLPPPGSISRALGLSVRELIRCPTPSLHINIFCSTLLYHTCLPIFRLNSA